MDRVISTLDQLDFFKEGACLLDLGCNDGHFASFFHNRVKYVGFDINKCAVLKAALRFPEEKFYCSDVYNELYNPDGKISAEEVKLPFKDESFDLVIAKSVFTHLGTFKAAENYMSEIKRCLKPGGKAFLTFFSSPPNEISESILRTVYLGREIDALLMGMEIIYTKVPETTEFNDQLELIAVKNG